MRQTVAYLRRHRAELDRIRLSRFKAIPGTRFHRQYESDPSRFPSLIDFEWDHRYARATYRQPEFSTREYRMAKRQLLDLVHGINSRPLPDGAEAFDGLM